MNSSEQIFAEKLRALVRFGTFSGRVKDIFDLCYLSDRVDKADLIKCIHTYILDDPDMRENDMTAVIKRVDRVFSDKGFKQSVENSGRDNWLQMKASVALELTLSETLIAEFYPFTDTFPDNLYNVWPVVRLDSGLQAIYYSPNAAIIFSSSTSAGLENT